MENLFAYKEPMTSIICATLDGLIYNVRDMSWMLKSMSIHKRDSKGIAKSNFVTSCFAFRCSITISQISESSMELSFKKEGYLRTRRVN